MKTAYPYRVLAGMVGLEVTAAKVDGREISYSRISRVERTVALDQVERADWETTALDVRAELPERELADGPWSEVVCLAVLTEKATNARTVQRLTRDHGTWTGTMRLHRASHRARATLALHVVATIDGQPGRLIGTSEEDWYIDLKASTPLRQREIEVNEIDFQEGPEEWLRPFRDVPWLVDTSGEIPIVHLNTAVEGLSELLNGGGSPLEKAVRSQLASQIAGDAWTTMFHSALAELDVDEDGSPQMPGGWRESVLRTMLPDVFPDRSPTDALFELYRHRSDGAGWADLQSRIQYAAARRSRLPRNLTAMVRTLDQAQEGVAR